MLIGQGERGGDDDTDDCADIITEVVGQIGRCHYRFEQSTVLSTVIKMGTIPNQSMS